MIFLFLLFQTTFETSFVNPYKVSNLFSKQIDRIKLCTMLDDNDKTVVQRRFRCDCCGVEKSSRNLLFEHIRSSHYDPFMDAESKISVKSYALLVAYESYFGDDKLMQTLSNALACDASANLQFIRATDIAYRFSNLLQQESSASSAGEVITCHGLDTKVVESTDWIEKVNEKLPATIRILGYQYIPKSAPLHAEQHCTAKVYEYLFPKDLIFRNFSAINDEHMKKDMHTSIRTVLRSLSSPKLSNYGGYKFRRSRSQYNITLNHRYHNYCEAKNILVVPTDAAVHRTVDKFTGEDILINGKAYLKFRISGDAFLNQQVRRMVGTAICILRGFLPSSFATMSLDPAVLIETPCAPAGYELLRECRYDWYYKYQRGMLLAHTRNDSDLYAHMMHNDLTRGPLYRKRLENWLDEMEHIVCPRIVSTMNKILAQSSLTLKEKDNPTSANKPNDISLPSELYDNDGDKDVPHVYKRVLQLLRQADVSGKWPTTSKARRRVMRVADGDTGGSFSVGRPVKGLASPRGNELFEELVEEVFALERVIMPDRPSSTMVAINRRASFLPHTDAGAGYGQSTSLIVGLGKYEGGELCVEGVAHDIRYKPLSFDGWRERHWTLPFTGERFSLVWFTPQEQVSGVAPNQVRYQTVP